MISCLLVHLSRNALGIAVRKETVVSGVSLGVGRGAECEIHLQDHRVYLHHATVKRSDDGILYLESEENAGFNLNGRIEQSTALPVGTQVEIGPYRMEVIPHPAQYDVALSIELLPEHTLEQETAKSRRRNDALKISALGFSKRKASAILVALILFAFLLIPLLPKVFPAVDRWQATSHTSLAATWSAGPLAGGHAVFGAKCSVCHQRAFHGIGVDVCVGCHKDIPGEMQKQATHFGFPDQMRCTECHYNHKGREGLAMRGDSTCVNCHANLKKWKPDTQHVDVSDFATAHPEFPLVPVEPAGGGKPRRPKEPNGLKLSHQIHTAKAGIQSPQGDVVLVCQDCHRIEESGLHFAPIQMERDCQQSGCHKVSFIEPLSGEIPHGSVNEVMQRVRSAYLKKLSAQPAALPSGCEKVRGNATQRVLECADLLSQRTLTTSAFAEDTDCGECHEISNDDDTISGWKFAPVEIKRNWFPTSSFSHAKHGASECTLCHDKRKSMLSAEIAMPSIKICRECHVGGEDGKYNIPGSCNTCHKFHGENRHVWRKPQQASDAQGEEK